MRIYSDKSFCDFIKKAMKNIVDTKFAGDYYHTLYPDDAKPVVIHKQTAQCTIVLAGTGIVVLNDASQRIQENDVILIDENVSHQFLANEPLTLFHIHIPFETAYSDREIISGDDFIHHF